ncbi:hypothetical protein CLV35_0815 [Motilibacter peucedani]|uniref:Uncharacterized protein n=1 Tax=Motilibacter peucedani TaxID=598650 RepID=A0A420XU77_9ACTN|nr:DUF5318 family protein [Motilibacter peucedani]RKS80384.1 hypothetical protein CLV35_0815 [Motilibacter peucedani]
MQARTRDVVDYALQRRAALAALATGRASREEVCDAQPYLRRAAVHLGELTDRLCPVCRREQLLQLVYVYGDELGQFSGRIRKAADLPEIAATSGDVKVYVVEVCAGPPVVPGVPRIDRGLDGRRDFRRPARTRQRGCGWNALVLSYVVGDGVPRRPPRRRPTIEDEL